MSTGVPGNNNRWDRGVPHHPVAVAIFELLAASDWEYGGDYFCWKKGGDGDNGETLMFALSELLDQEPARVEALAQVLNPGLRR